MVVRVRRVSCDRPLGRVPSTQRECRVCGQVRPSPAEYEKAMRAHTGPTHILTDSRRREGGALAPRSRPGACNDASRPLRTRSCASGVPVSKTWLQHGRCCTKAPCKVSARLSVAADVSVSVAIAFLRSAMALRTSPSSVLAPACEDAAANVAAARPISAAKALTICSIVASLSCVARRPSPLRRMNRPTRESVHHLRLRDFADAPSFATTGAAARFVGDTALWYGRIEASVAWFGRYRFDGVVGIDRGRLVV